jgi:hypothetical protein
MKKTAYISIAVVFALCVGLSACELLDCKTCELVTRTNGVETARGPGRQFCGDELAEKESYSETVGNIHTYYDCN